MRTRESELEKGTAYRAMLVRAIHGCATKFATVAESVVAVLMDFLGGDGANPIVAFEYSSLLLRAARGGEMFAEVSGGGVVVGSGGTNNGGGDASLSSSFFPNNEFVGGMLVLSSSSVFFFFWPPGTNAGAFAFMNT